MRALLPALLLAILGPASAATTPAAPVPADLQPLAAALAPLRGMHGVNKDRNGPELTPVKQAIRLWVEQNLPPAPMPDVTGIVHSVEPADLNEAQWAGHCSFAQTASIIRRSPSTPS